MGWMITSRYGLRCCVRMSNEAGWQIGSMMAKLWIDPPAGLSCLHITMEIS